MNVDVDLYHLAEIVFVKFFFCKFFLFSTVKISPHFHIYLEETHYVEPISQE